MGTTAFCNGHSAEADMAWLVDIYRDFFTCISGAIDRINRQNLGWGDEEVCALARALPRFTALRNLHLEGNSKMGVKGGTAIGEACVYISQYPPPYNALRVLTLDAVAVPLSVPSLRGFAIARSIDLSHRKLHAASAAAIATMLTGVYPKAAGNKTLTALDCRYNFDMVGDAAEQLAAAVLSRPLLQTFSLIPIGLLRLQKVQELNIFDRGLGVTEAHVLSSCLRDAKSCASLTELSIGQNQICTEGAVALASALHHNDTLTTLRLDGNMIGDDGAAALADALDENGNATLKILDLSRNRIGDYGASQLSHAAKLSRSLHTLHLSASCQSEAEKVGHAGAAALASAVAKSPGLAVLDLANNPLGALGANALAEALSTAKEPRLEVLDVRQTRPSRGNLDQGEDRQLRRAVQNRKGFVLRAGTMWN